MTATYERKKEESTQTTTMYRPVLINRPTQADRSVITASRLICLRHSTLLNTIYCSIDFETSFVSCQLRCPGWRLTSKTESNMWRSVSSRRQSCRLRTFGVLQGSALGPILFAACTSPVGGTIKIHVDCYHRYSDDTQLPSELINTDAGLSILADRTMDVTHRQPIPVKRSATKRW